MNPTVSIVTPSYNQAEYLEETIRSVLEQDYKPIEYVVVDDGSTDGSVEIAERYEDRLTLIRQENCGQPGAINRGFAQTSAELMGYLNSDDTLLPGAVEAMVAELEREPKALLVYGDAHYTDERSERTGYLRAREFDVAEMQRSCNNHVVQPSTLWRREAWESYGPFDEDAYYFFDFEFFVRFPPDRVRRLERPLSTYRVHAAAKSAGADGARLAQDHARLAKRLPTRQGRSNALLLGAEFAYDSLDLQRARRHVLAGLVLYPPHLSRRWVSLLAKTLLPRPVVRRLRHRRSTTAIVR
jgi:glycosyltransferase involved in cell wall biosynthesis